MDFFELLAAIVIAIYAMIGGAFLNAAITSPHNTRKLLVRIWGSVFEVLIYGAAMLAMAIIGGVLTTSLYTSFFGNPFIWAGTAHLILGGIFWVCGVIVDVLVDEEEPPLDSTDD